MLYVVNNSRFDSGNFAYGEETGHRNLGDALKCPSCCKFVTAKQWLPPYSIKISQNEIGDVVFGSFDNFIVSKRFVDTFRANRLNGINRFEPVSILYRNVHTAQEYFYPQIQLLYHKIDLEKSGIGLTEGKECEYCQRSGRNIKAMRGLVFLGDRDIEDDIFNPVFLPGTIVVSSRFKSVMETMSNLTFISAEDYIPSYLRNAEC